MDNTAKSLRKPSYADNLKCMNIITCFFQTVLRVTVISITQISKSVTVPQGGGVIQKNFALFPPPTCSLIKALQTLRCADFDTKSSQICQWKIDFHNPTVSKMVRTCLNRSQTSKLIIRNTFWTSISDTGGKAGGPLRGPGSVIILYNNTFEMNSHLHWL